MTKVLVIHTGNPSTMFENMHTLGTCFYCPIGEMQYKVVYFATNRQVFFEGELTVYELEKLKGHGREVKKIEVDDFTQEIRVKE